MKKITFILFALLAFSLSACNLKSTTKSETATTADKQVTQWLKQGDFGFDKKEFDLGEVKQSEGTASAEFKVKYFGKDPIEVTGLPASCACTTAKLSQNKFNTGDEAILTVFFNPNKHPEPKEKFFRTVSFVTKPKLEESPEVKIWIKHIEDLGPSAYELPADDDEETAPVCEGGSCETQENSDHTH